jgi:NADPH:quinone reductase-like Zn-dependent oxidoreductase
LETASQLLVNPVTVVAMLDVLGIKEGEILLQSAANSTLGRIMIQVCAMRGIKTLNIIRRPELADELLALGGDFVVVSHDDGKDISKQVSQILKSKGISTGIKYAIDPVGGLTGTFFRFHLLVNSSL